MPQEVRMPAVGQTTDQLLIISWLKAEGDAVRLGEPLLEVETDKATLEVEAFVAGTVLRILHQAGETVEVGTPIAYIGALGERLPQAGESTPAEASTAPESAHDDLSPGVQAADKVLASPVARNLAKSHGIDLNTVRGSGPRGRIEKVDVQALIDAASAPISVTAVGSGELSSEIPVAVVKPSDLAAHAEESAVPRHRQVIAQRLTHSVQTIPHIALTVSIDMRGARAALTSGRDAGLTKLTYTHLMLRAIAQALRAYPEVNRVWSTAGGTTQYRSIDGATVGLAVAGDDTLLVASIGEADTGTLADVVRLTDEAVRRARSSTQSAADAKPAAIILSNLGMYRVDSFQAIIDPDQTAILATGRITDQVVAVDGGIHIVPKLQATLSIDHRVADGVLAAKFLGAIVERLEARAH